MLELIINTCLLISLVVLAFSWGYEKGRGDALEEELKELEEDAKRKLVGAHGQDTQDT